MAILRQALLVVLLSFLPGMPGIVVAEENALTPGGVVIELLVNAETGFTAITSPTSSLLINCRALEGQFILNRGEFNGIGAGCTVESIGGTALAVELQEAVETIFELTGDPFDTNPAGGGDSPAIRDITTPPPTNQNQTEIILIQNQADLQATPQETVN